MTVSSFVSHHEFRLHSQACTKGLAWPVGGGIPYLLDKIMLKKKCILLIIVGEIAV